MTPVRTLVSCSARYNVKAMLPYLAGKEAECAEHITDVKKGEVHPRTAHEGPEGEWRYCSTFYSASALDTGEWSTPPAGSFTSGKDTTAIQSILKQNTPSVSPYTVQVFVGDYRCFGEPAVSTFILPQDEDSRFLQKLVITRLQCAINQKTSLKFQRYENHKSH